MDEGQLHRGLIFLGEIPLVFLRNTLAKNSANLDYCTLLSSLSSIEIDPCGKILGLLGTPSERKDDHDLKRWFVEIGRLADAVCGEPNFQSNTLIKHMVRISVDCLSGQSRISRHFLPDLFKNRPYEKILKQLSLDMCDDNPDLDLAHKQIQQLEKSKSTLASIVFPAGIHRACQLSEINIREQIGPLILEASDLDRAVEEAASDAFLFVEETDRLNKGRMRDKFKRYFESFEEYEVFKSRGLAKEAADLKSDIEYKVQRFDIQEYGNEEEVKLVTEVAEGGMAEAQFKLGEMLIIRDRDFDAGAVWLLKAANQNHTNAQWELSRLYLRGEGVLQSEDHALKWITKAAENSHYSAIAELANGFLYGHDEHIPNNLDEAEKWLSVLATSTLWLGQSRYEAQARLGLCHQKKGDLIEAYKWFLASGLEVSADFKSSEDRLSRTPQKHEVEDWNKQIAESLEELKKEMTSEMISTAKTKAAAWWEERSLNQDLR